MRGVKTTRPALRISERQRSSTVMITNQDQIKVYEAIKRLFLNYVDLVDHRMPSKYKVADEGPDFNKTKYLKYFDYLTIQKAVNFNRNKLKQALHALKESGHIDTYQVDKMRYYFPTKIYGYHPFGERYFVKDN